MKLFQENNNSPFGLKGLSLKNKNTEKSFS